MVGEVVGSLLSREAAAFENMTWMQLSPASLLVWRPHQSCVDVTLMQLYETAPLWHFQNFTDSVNHISWGKKIVN